MQWTEEKVETLRRLWGSGMTAAQIAEKLGEGVSRNAVIGKAHRLGLSAGGAKNAKPKPRKKAAEKAKPAATKTRAGKKSDELPWQRRCQWPHGHPGEPDFHFCGAEAVAGRPYCAEHCAIAYRQKDEAA